MKSGLTKTEGGVMRCSKKEVVHREEVSDREVRQILGE